MSIGEEYKKNIIAVSVQRQKSTVLCLYYFLFIIIIPRQYSF